MGCTLVEKLPKPLNQFLDAPERDLLASILPVKEEHGQAQLNIWDTQSWNDAHTFVTRTEEGKCLGTVVRETRVRKEDGQRESELARKRKEVGRQIAPCWQRSWEPPSFGCVIIALGLKKKKVTFLSVPLKVTHVSLELRKRNAVVYYSLLNFKVVKAHPLSLLGQKDCDMLFKTSLTR